MSDQKSDMNRNDRELNDSEPRGDAPADETRPHPDEKTAAGQEAIKNPPRNHSYEHHSNYGGGGAHGGANGGAKKT